MICLLYTSVIDVEFEDSDLPFIKDALEVNNDGKRCVMEVAQHIGNNTVRCIMLASSEGLHKDMEVIATGGGIKVPVGELSLIHIYATWQNRLEYTAQTAGAYGHSSE